MDSVGRIVLIPISALPVDTITARIIVDRVRAGFIHVVTLDDALLLSTENVEYLIKDTNNPDIKSAMALANGIVEDTSIEKFRSYIEGGTINENQN
ncbi:hypothetical protein BpsS140_00007 [Bacillus phage vB_BpsS-140]|nr:hypothetical protein BpsS140_00007 [Bacillus phage vB_BpsS-140]